ncbi:GNAT family N-acetyltransferase [Flavobacteriales bacterium]|nr:GNAT family N-acetyltransferase [Flavobacteriales bacterium]
MLKGANIVLRSLQESDLDFLERIENNTDNWKFGSERRKFNRKELLGYIANAETDIKAAKQYRFVITFNNLPIGFIDLFNYTLASAGVGVIITENYRNKGFAKEALTLLSTYALTAVNLSKLHCAITKDNVASIKLFTSCGFELEREEQDLKYFIKLAKK